MKIYAVEKSEFFELSKYEYHLSDKVFDKAVKLSELRELLKKKNSDDYGSKMSNTGFFHRAKLIRELLAELDTSDSRQEKIAVKKPLKKSSATHDDTLTASPKKKVTK